MSTKETRDGIISILYLGFVDRLGQLVRVNLIGREALKEMRSFHKNKYYYINNGLKTVQLERLNECQIRLKAK
jgi:hypothetical protein